MNRQGSRGGFWPALMGVIIGSAGLFGYMSYYGQTELKLDLGDAEDYAEFLEDRGDIEPPVPFKPEPLEVRARADIKAVPDIAVITAVMTAEDRLESRAVDDVAKRVNAVQAAIAGFDTETSVTDAKTSRKYDPLCRSDNNEARRRHNQINQDYWFNRRLDERGDTKTKRRDPKPRLAQKICRAQSIEARTALVIRVAPPEAAGDVLQALADAGADTTRLYGYDFSNYDALYQDAAVKAVEKARAKAEMIARHAQAELGDIVEFYVGAPARTGRFGPQPAIIKRSSIPDTQFSIPLSIISAEELGDIAFNNVADGLSAVPAFGGGYSEDEVVVTGSRLRKVGERDEYKQDEVDEDSEEDAVPRSSNNALQMSLLSGPQTIRVSAILAYDYKTVIDDTVVAVEDN